MNIRILVCGGRDFNDVALVHQTLDNFLKDRPIIIQGGAKGADAIARDWCIRRNMDCINFPANWNKYGRGAGPIRNKQMIEEGLPDLVISFPGGSGTANMIAQARKSNINVIEVSI